jgi:uncharacterized protein with HEPN domain
MNKKISDKERLRHILDAISDIEEFTKGTSYKAFSNNKMMKLAVVRLIEIIGEASTSLSDELKDEYIDIEWPVLKGIRNIVVHEYFGINYTIIWSSIQKDIPPLKIKLQNILKIKTGCNL